jgi:aldehyde:ferredoxin oxidoreductase
MLDKYYQLHGWEASGVPSVETVRRLELDNLAEVPL